MITKKSLLSVCFFFVITFCLSGKEASSPAKSFAPAAGQTGSTAIHMDSSAFQSWATGIDVERGFINIADTTITYDGSNKASFGTPENALGKASGNSTDVVSLGDGGMAILTFDRPIINGKGPDFAVFENSFTDTYLELAFVEVSSDGEHFVRFPAVSKTQDTVQIDGFGQLAPENLYNFAGKYRQGYGTPFDLDELKDSAGIDLNNVRFVRIIDVAGSIDPQYASYDSEGNIVNDPWPTPFNTGGFDLDAVGIINAGMPDNPNDIELSFTENMNILAYPNPFTSHLYVECAEGSVITLYDQLGRVVLREQVVATPHYMATDGLQSGAYFLQMTDGVSSKIIQVIKP